MPSMFIVSVAITSESGLRFALRSSAGSSVNGVRMYVNSAKATLNSRCTMVLARTKLFRTLLYFHSLNDTHCRPFGTDAVIDANSSFIGGDMGILLRIAVTMAATRRLMAKITRRASSRAELCFLLYFGCIQA